MAEYTFPTAIRYGRPPVEIPDGTVAFVAPRPLYGTPVDLGLGGWAGQVFVDLDRPDAAHILERNRALDATVVRWVNQDEVIGRERARLTAEYGADALDGIDDRVILASAALDAPATVVVVVV